MTKLAFARDVNGYNAYAPQVSAIKVSATLASNGDATYTLPTSAPNWVVNFSFTPGSNVWVAVNGNAAAPAGSTFASTNSELNPGSRIVSSVQSDGITNTTINVLNTGANSADIGIVIYANA